MKPRQRKAPLTQEDKEIIESHWYVRQGPHLLIHPLWFIQWESDERDAELMFNCQRYRSYTFPVDLPPLRWISADGAEWLPCGGALWEWKPLNLSYFA